MGYVCAINLRGTPDKGTDTALAQVLHTAFLTPYFSWKISHHRHHMSAASMERDELWIPRLKSELNMLTSGEGPLDYEDYLGDTPLYTLVSLIVQQIVGFPLYLSEWRPRVSLTSLV